MTKRMLIDATHPEETRVAVISGNRLEEYDYETVVRKQLKGNIYLVKVTRVEPSLQAAFVDFGGNRHGFLPFPEIHPDYYRIPIADREALIAEERAIAAAQQAKEDAEDEAELAAGGGDERGSEDDRGEEEDAPSEDAEGDAEDTYVPRHAGSLAAEIASDRVHDEDDAEDEETSPAEGHSHGDAEHAVEAAGESEAEADPNVDIVGGDAAETPVFRSSIKRRYKIQEVIKRNQIMLIQINKEERGNKGAAVTSYISLPGRYCVLMPNSPRGGGVSRKVSNAKDRQRLKVVLRELNVPEGMSVILRTAGVARATAEIKRDLDYLLRLWDEIRELTLKSTAPALIYEEGNLVKRAIRDLYRRDIDEVLVAGDVAHATAQDFMKTLMPSHADKVIKYSDQTVPLFFRHQVESQIDAIHSPTVHLKSGGYIVINPTEALVSIDINSGRATKGRHIEETALKTNLEAADEIARQLRLRDLGGLIVIDFIDMEDRRGNRNVEKRLRDAMANDRARIQLGRISAFGLLELSRQRLHPSLVESNFEAACTHCAGTGLTRTVETSAVMLLRAIEEEGLKGRAAEIKVSVPPEIGLYVFNHQREMLASIEKRHGIRVFIGADDTLIKPNYTIEVLRSTGVAPQPRWKPQPVQGVDMSDAGDFGDAGGAELSAGPEVLDDAFDRGGGESRGRGGDRGGDRGGRGRDRGGRGRDRGGRGRDRGDRGDRPDRGGDRNGGARDHQRGGGQQPHDHAPHGGQVAQGGADQQPHDGGGAEQPQGQQSHGGGHSGGEARGEDAGRRSRGRRGGRRRGGRDRDNRGGRERGDRNDAASSNNAVPGTGEQPRDTRAESAERTYSAAPSAPAAEPQFTPRRAEPAPSPSYSAESAPGGGGNDDAAGGASRKGWWKRLTE